LVVLLPRDRRAPRLGPDSLARLGKASNCIRWDEVRILRRGIGLACSKNDHFHDAVFPSKAVSLRFESSKYSASKKQSSIYLSQMSKANSVESHPEGKVAIRINVVRPGCYRSVLN
jgi:hypothetical protein